MEWWQIQQLMVTSAGILAGLTLVAGLTVRFAVKPFLKDWKEMKAAKGGESPSLPDRRLDRLEQQLDVVEQSVTRLLEVAEFDRQLKAGKPPEVPR